VSSKVRNQAEAKLYSFKAADEAESKKGHEDVEANQTLKV